MKTKKSSASSRPARLVSVSAEEAFGRPISKQQKAALARMAKRQAADDDSGIDFSDIPELTDAQLKEFRPASEVKPHLFKRPPVVPKLTKAQIAALEPKPKVFVGARLDQDVIDWLKTFGPGYSTRINSILRAVMAHAK